MKSQYLYLIFTLHFGSFCFGQTNEGIVHHYFNNFEDSITNKEWLNTNSIISSNDSVQNHFSRCDESNHYSSGIEIVIPADLRHKNFRITVTGSIRVTNVDAKNELVISVSKNDSTIFWKGEHLPDTAGKTNKWNKFKTFALIPMSIPGESKIKLFLWNADGKSITDLDDLDIYFNEMKFPSFLPN